MINGYDIAYAIGLGVSAPFWLIRPQSRSKVLKALRERMGPVTPRKATSPTLMIHAVSLGEINAARTMITMLADARADLHFVVTVTTDTGYARGMELYGNNPRVTLIRYPLDFTGAVNRLLDGLRPDVVVLMELEVWPNFVYQCSRRRIPVILVNGRITPGSFRNYRMGGPLVRKMFRRLTAICAQEQSYADRFIALGARPENVQITGTMKFDTAQITDTVTGSQELAQAVGLRPSQESIWVCGSTGPGEEAIILGIYRHLLNEFPQLRLVIVPRKPERFDEVAELICKFGFDLVRRSKSQIPDLKSDQPVILGDTMGELRKFYSLADVVFVGRSLVDLGSRQHGSDMIEPAALAKPTVVGPFTGNFAEVMNRFRSGSGIAEAGTAEDLQLHIRGLLENRVQAVEMGLRAQEIVQNSQGTTARHVQIVLDQFNVVPSPPAITGKETI